MAKKKAAGIIDTPLSDFLTVKGIHFVAAAIVRDALESESDAEFLAAFGKTKIEALEFLECYELCRMPYWGAAELASVMTHPEVNPDKARNLRAIELAQKAGALSDPFTPRDGVEWAMAHCYPVDSNYPAFLGLSPGTYGKRIAQSDIAPEASPAPASAPEGKQLPWWQVSYQLDEIYQIKGETLHSKGERTSNAAIAKEIASHINAKERSKGSQRDIDSETIRKALANRKWQPE